MKRGVRVSATSWVGVVRFQQFEIRVVPKLAGDALDLLQMIRFASGLETLRRLPSCRDVDTSKCGLLELFVLLLAEQCERLVRNGLLADYVHQNEWLGVVRGRIDVRRQVTERFGRCDQVACSHDDRRHDIGENRLLTAALQAARRCPLPPALGQRVSLLADLFGDVAGGDDGRPVRRAVEYHRLNEHYRDAHVLANLVIDGLGAGDLLSGGRVNSYAFLFDMNSLFERFVWRACHRLLSPHQFRVRYQLADDSVIREAGGRPYGRVIPDLVVERAPTFEVRLPIDAKYKAYDDRHVANSDIYQAFVYAQAYGEAKNHIRDAAVLLYPSQQATSEPLRLRVRRADNTFAEILVLGWHVPSVLNELQTGKHGPQSQRLLEAVERYTKPVVVPAVTSPPPVTAVVGLSSGG
ncbi:MAG: hypothetical protein NTV05_03715 [Acidobacteria bacterium]|nr:hypothetical protein [Acidobacteriota bacterium]